MCDGAALANTRHKNDRLQGQLNKAEAERDRLRAALETGISRERTLLALASRIREVIHRHALWAGTDEDVLLRDFTAVLDGYPDLDALSNPAATTEDGS